MQYPRIFSYKENVLVYNIQVLDPFGDLRNPFNYINLN